MKTSSDHLGDIRLFIAVAETKSLTTAAPRFGFSVAAASLRLSRLEKRLGVKLINRSTKKNVLTDIGQFYLKRCTAALRIIDDVESNLFSYQTSSEGSIKVSVATDFGRKYLYHWLDEFYTLYPKIRVSLFLEDDYSNINENGIEVAVRFGKPLENSLIIKRLAPNYRVLCASTKYLEKYGTPQTPEDLVKHKFIVLATRKKILNEYYFQHNGVKTKYMVLPDQMLEVNDGEIATQLAISGRGITRKTIWDAINSITSGDLKIILPEYTMNEEGIFYVRNNNKYLAQRVRLFLDFLEKKFNEESHKIIHYLDFFK